MLPELDKWLSGSIGLVNKEGVSNFRDTFFYLYSQNTTHYPMPKVTAGSMVTDPADRKNLRPH